MNIKVQDLKDKGKKIIAQFDKDAVVYLVLLIGILFFCGSKFIMPACSKLITNSKNFLETKDSAESMQKRLLLTQQLQKKKVITETELPVTIYKVPYKDMDLESAAADFINEVIHIVKTNGNNKILLLDFEKKELADKMGITSKKHSVLSVKLEVESTYESIQNVLNEIYLMKNIVKINTISLSAMKKYNFQRVQTYIVFDLLLDIS